MYLKLLYSAQNSLQATFDTLRDKTTGLLVEIEDKRNKKFVGTIGYQPKHVSKNNVVFDGPLVFNQYPFFICVWASATVAASNQNGIRFSVRWMCKLGRKYGYISGKGLSYLRAAKNCEKKYGHLPYELMSDEINGMTWDEYSRWTKEDEMFLKVAEQFRVSEYEQVRTQAEIFELIDQGRCLSTGAKWFEGMNRVYPPNFKMEASGGLLGAHAYPIVGYGQNNILNSFGVSWGNEGYAFDPGHFESNDYAIYTVPLLPDESHWFYISTILDGKAVKTKDSPHIYHISDKKKYRIPDMETFVKDFNSFTTVMPQGLALIPDAGVYNP